MKKAVDKHSIPHGTGYYFRALDSSITRCVWRDTKAVAVASTAFTGHSVSNVVRRVKDSVSGASVTKEVPCPMMLAEYNRSMEGVDKSNQYISYHKVLRSTVKYWKTMFYHVLDINIVNSHVIFNWCRLKNGYEVVTENQFRDSLIMVIITNDGLLTHMLIQDYCLAEHLLVGFTMVANCSIQKQDVFFTSFTEREDLLKERQMAHSHHLYVKF